MILLFPIFLLSYLSLSITEAFAQALPRTNSFARVPVVTIGGYIDTHASLNKQDTFYSQDRLPDAELQNSQIDTYTTNNPSNKAYGSNNRNSRPLVMSNDAKIQVKVNGITDYGLQYGAYFQLLALPTYDGNSQNVNSDRSFMFLESEYGKIEFGNTISASQKMQIGAETFARAAGGINGAYLQYINPPMLTHPSQVTGVPIVNKANYENNVFGAVRLPKFIVIPQSPIAHGGYAYSAYNGTNAKYKDDYVTDVPDLNGDGVEQANETLRYKASFNRNKTAKDQRQGKLAEIEAATKISYYTPRVAGLQAGGSFTPDTGNRGAMQYNSGNMSGDIANVVDWGVNYITAFSGLGISLSFTGNTGSFEQDKNNPVRNNLSTYAVGGNLTYQNLTLGASYGFWGDSLWRLDELNCDYGSTTTTTDCNTNKGVAFSNAYYITAGGAYQIGPFSGSVGYFKSDFQNNRYSALSFGADYKLAAGFMPYIETTFFNFEPNLPPEDRNKNPSNQETRQVKDNSGYVVLVGALFRF